MGSDCSHACRRSSDVYTKAPLRVPTSRCTWADMLSSSFWRSALLRAGLCGWSEYRATDGEDGWQRAGQPLPVVAAVGAGEDLAVAGANVDALRIEAVCVEALAVDALVVVRTGKAVRQRLPRLAAVPRSVHGELAERDAEVVLAVVQRHHIDRVGL